MKELQQIVNDKIQSMISEGVIQEAIESNIESAVTKAIAKQFECYGALTKQLEEALKDGLQINTKDIPFETYNQQMLVAVKQKMGAVFASEASVKFMEDMDKLLAPAPKEMSINELVEAIAESWKTDEPWNTDELDENATVELAEWEYGRDSYHLKMWKQKEYSPSFSSRTNDPDLDLFISDNKIRISHKQNYNPTFFLSMKRLFSNFMQLEPG